MIRYILVLQSLQNRIENSSSSSKARHWSGDAFIVGRTGNSRNCLLDASHTINELQGSHRFNCSAFCGCKRFGRCGDEHISRPHNLQWCRRTAKEKGVWQMQQFGCSASSCHFTTFCSAGRLIACKRCNLCSCLAVSYTHLTLPTKRIV